MDRSAVEQEISGVGVFEKYARSSRPPFDWFMSRMCGNTTGDTRSLGMSPFKEQFALLIVEEKQFTDME